MVTWDRLNEIFQSSKDWAIFFQARYELAMKYKARGNKHAKYKVKSLLGDASEAWELSKF